MTDRMCMCVLIIVLMAASSHPLTPLLCKHINTDKLLSYVDLHTLYFKASSKG